MQQGDGTAAADALKRLVGGEGDSEMVHCQLALLAASANDWQKSLQQAQAALELAPDSTLSRLLAAVACLKTEQPDSVAEVLAPVLEANPLEVGALTLACRATKARGNTDEVQRLQALLERIEKLAPGQYRAGLAQVTSLENGEDIDCLTIDTIRGKTEMPGREP
jgi:predicted Zn-dependent protease